ncbi:hypothetical protein RFI_03553 [Reticulomyxa filosa]|uniref:RZ-type domain-containing protein n=1 Tax=Reticulomyxa filosa TaxID=46433 RepID=X6P5R4_RETFI|nr:hypothetical protein RFI_03553 [Reticulomyxa filosa]|eukprot:ETO33546.1 hypothetical protein RFI_03553 [Reticulomyxa filosa]
MPENAHMDIIRVMKNTGNEGKTFTIRYCPNGHPFIIGACGHPTEKVICAVDRCGKEIGDLIYIDTNTGLKELEIPKGYVLDGSDEELSIGDSFWRFEGKQEIRRIYEVACTLLRLLIHLSLLIRNAAVQEGCKQLQELLKKESAEEVTKFLEKQAIGYFQLLGKITELNDELLAVALHQMLDGLPQIFNRWYPNGLDGTDLITTYDFEKKFDSQYAGFFSRLEKFNELNNRSRIAMDEDKAMKEIFSEIEEKKQLTNPITSNISRIYEIWSVKYLPVIGQWMRHVYFHYSRQITQQECQLKTVTQVIEEWQQKGYGSEAKSYLQLWSGFKTCWNALANQTVKNDCKSFTIPRLDEDDKISLEFSTAQNKNNGLIIVKIIQLLQDAHNTFLEDVMEKYEKTINHEEKHEAKNDCRYMQKIIGKNKSLFNIHESDVVCLDKDQVTKIIQQWSLPSLKYGAINKARNDTLDLYAIENEIAHRFIKTRQILEIGIPFLQFSNQLNIKNCIDIIEENNKELKKEPFDQPLLQMFLSSLQSQSEMQRALGILNEVIVFVSQNIKIFELQINKNYLHVLMSCCFYFIFFMHRDKYFVELLEQMSFDEKNRKLFMMDLEDRQENFILCRHMCSLWRLLNNAVQSTFVDKSTIDNCVLDTYKKSLTEQLKQQLQATVENTSLRTTEKILDEWRDTAQIEGQKNE